MKYSDIAHHVSKLVDLPPPRKVFDLTRLTVCVYVRCSGTKCLDHPYTPGALSPSLSPSLFLLLLHVTLPFTYTK